MTATYVAALALVAVGAAVQGSVGFGMNLIAAPLLITIDERFVPGPLLLASTVLVLLVVRRERANFELRPMAWAIAGRVPGSVAGAVAVASLSRDALAILLAVSVLAAVGLSLGGVHVPVTKPNLFGAGVVSGFTGTSVAIGGPPMALLLQHGSGASIRANLSGFFAATSTFSILALVPTGDLSADHLRLAAGLVPAAVVGFVVSTRVAHHFDGDRARPAVLTIAAISAAAVLARTMLA